jgi:outer membrane protein assembly factor BamE
MPLPMEPSSPGGGVSPVAPQVRGVLERRGAGLWAALVAAGTALLGLCLSTGCVYHMPIRQGNYLDPTVVAQVKPGMTHSQVRFLLGTPMVPDGFEDDRWDYDYYLDQGRLKNKQHAHVTVYFQGNAVTRVVSDVHGTPVTTVTRGGVKYPVPF